MGDPGDSFCREEGTFLSIIIWRSHTELSSHGGVFRKNPGTWMNLGRDLGVTLQNLPVRKTRKAFTAGWCLPRGHPATGKRNINNTWGRFPSQGATSESREGGGHSCHKFMTVKGGVPSYGSPFKLQMPWPGSPHRELELLVRKKFSPLGVKTGLQGKF